MTEDRFTNTVEDAAAFERIFSPAYYEDRPALSDVVEYENGIAFEYEEGELADRISQVSHPEWCTQPPGHPPYQVRHDGPMTFIQNCEPAP